MKSIYYSFICLIFFASCASESKDKNNSQGITAPVVLGKNTLDEINEEIINNPESPNGYYKRAFYYKNNYDYPNAITDINRALKLTPDVAALNYLKSEILFNQAGATANPILYEQCEIYLAQTLKLDSTYVDAQILGARINMSKPNLDKAMQNLDAALKINKYFAPAYFWKGMIFELKNELEKAKSSYQTAIELDAKYYDALHHLANCYAKDLDPKAETYYDAALDIDPTSFEVLRNKGLFLKDIGNYEKAKICFEKILIDDANCPECYFNLGNTYIASYRDDMSKLSKDTTISKSIEYFEDAIKLDATYSDAIYNLGWLHEFKGEKKLAIKYYQQVLDIDPEHEPTLEALRSL